MAPNPRASRLATLLLGLAALACGHKAPPLPPPLLNPAPTSDLKIQQRGDELILSFTYPLTTASGLPLATVDKVEYWELVKPAVPPPLGLEDEAEGEEGEGGAEEPTEGEETAVDESEAGDEAEATEDEEEEVLPLGAAPVSGPLPPPPTKEQIAAVEILEFVATAELKLTLETEELAAATVGDKVVLRLPFRKDEEEETAYIYAVKTYSDARRVSTWSNLATLVRRDPPPTPVEFKIEAEAGGVKISWFNQKALDRRQAIEEATKAGQPPPPPTPAPTLAPGEENTAETKVYRIYRRDAQARVYPPHIGQALSDADEYLDRTAQYGSRYIYSLTAVGLYSPLIESSFAGESEIDFQDRFAPPPPANPIALAEPGRVRLLWDASPAPDLKGYIVFRRKKGEQDFRRMTTKPIVDLEYNDREVDPATEYEYRVAAVDGVGNQGDPSATVGARVP